MRFTAQPNACSKDPLASKLNPGRRALAICLQIFSFDASCLQTLKILGSVADRPGCNCVEKPNLMRRIQCGPLASASFGRERVSDVELSQGGEDARCHAAVRWDRHDPVRRRSHTRPGRLVSRAVDVLPGTERWTPPRPGSGMPLFGCGSQLGQEYLPHLVERLLGTRKRRAHHVGWTRRTTSGGDAEALVRFSLHVLRDTVIKGWKHVGVKRRQAPPRHPRRPTAGLTTFSGSVVAQRHRGQRRLYAPRLSLGGQLFQTTLSAPAASR